MSNNKYKILIIEDEANIRSFVKTMLESNDYSVLLASTCHMGKTIYLSHNADLIILDLGLPDEDGLEFIRFIRKDSITPIIVLSARNNEKDKVEALDMGANDYVTKPFSTAELLARIRATLRNSHRNNDTGVILGNKFLLKDMEINYDKRVVYINNVNVNLTQTEYNIVDFLSKHAGKVLTYNTIIKAVWGYPDAGSIKKLQVNMANIRKKLGVSPGENKYIINELGVGYRMLEENE